MANLEQTKSKRLVPVLVNREGQVQIPTKREHDGSINPAGILFLVSGYNLVDEELWNEARKNPMVKLLLETKIPPANAPEENPERVGHMILVERKPVDADNPLAALPEERAIEFISETFFVPLLQKLEQQESRALVLRTIRAQIEKIEKPKQAAKAAAAAARA